MNQKQQTPVIFTPNLENTLKNMQRQIDTVQAQVKSLQELFGNSVSLSQLKLSEKRMKTLISSNAALITNLEEKLSLVSLPDETKYYLKESETEFKERVSDARYKFLSRERVVPNKKHYNRKEKHKTLVY